MGLSILSSLILMIYSLSSLAGSPFHLRVAAAPDPKQVRCFGPGLEHGILSTFNGRFICETRGAGAGQLKVRVHGPKGKDGEGEGYEEGSGGVVGGERVTVMGGRGIFNGRFINSK